MATYKKRGNKIKKKAVDVEDLTPEIDPNVEENSTTAEVFNTLDETASKSEQWIEKNSKPLLIAFLVVAGALLAYLGYNKFVKEPKELEAADELAYSKRYFDEAQNATVEVDSLYNLALNGTDGKYGLIDIVDNYGSTNAGNLAKYMAGISYLKKKDYENAIEYLGNFSTEDEILGALALGNIGDAFSDIDQPEQALEYYEKAANFKSNSFTSPIYLMKAGNTALDLKQFAKAEELFTRIKDKYATTEEGRNVQQYINKAKLAQQ